MEELGEETNAGRVEVETIGTDGTVERDTSAVGRARFQLQAKASDLSDNG